MEHVDAVPALRRVGAKGEGVDRAADRVDDGVGEARLCACVRVCIGGCG